MKRLALLILLMAPAAFGVCTLPIVESYTFNGIPADADSIRYRVYSYYDGSVLYNVAATMDSFYATLVNVDSSGEYRVVTTVYANSQRLMSTYFVQSNCSGTPPNLALDSIKNAIADVNKANFGRWSVAQRDSILSAITDVNKANFMRWSAAQRDSLINAITDVNKANLGRWTAAQLDSVLNAIKDANKVNFGRWSAAQRDSLLNTILDANKVNFGRWSVAQRDSILNAITDINKANFGGAVVISQADIDSIVAGVIAGTAASNGTGIYAVTLYAQDTTNSAFVQGINLTAVSGATTYFATTNDAGYAVFNVDSSTWTFNALGSPYTWVPFSRGISANTTDTINGGGVLVSAPSSADEATIYGTLIGGDGELAANWDVRFTLEDVKANLADTATGQIVVIKVIETSTNGSGYFTKGLLKTENMLYKSGSQYKHPVWRMVASPSDVKVDPRLDFTFSIPSDSTSVDLGLLIKQGVE